MKLDFDKARLGIDNKRLSALVCALIKSQGGVATIPKSIANIEWSRATLNYYETPEGDVVVTLVEDKSGA